MAPEFPEREANRIYCEMCDMDKFKTWVESQADGAIIGYALGGVTNPIANWGRHIAASKGYPNACVDVDLHRIRIALYPWGRWYHYDLAKWHVSVLKQLRLGSKSLVTKEDVAAALD
jgi:hypothetical protein